MGKNSVVGSVVHAATHSSDWTNAGNKVYHAATHLSDFGDMIFGKKPGAPEDAGSPADNGATEGATMQSSMLAAIARERQRLQSSTMLSGVGYMGGTSDNAVPSTASRILLGGN